VHKTNSAERPYQAKLTLNKGEGQTSLGSFATAEEAAVAVARAKYTGQQWKDDSSSALRVTASGRGASRASLSSLPMLPE